MTLGKFCSGSEFFNQTLLLYNWYPEFTECFQYTALTFGPCGFLWLSSLALLGFLKYHVKYVSVRWSWQLGARVGCAVVLCLLALLHLLALESQDAPSQAFYVSKLIWAATFAYVAVLLVVCRRGGVVSPCVVFIYWLLAVISYVVPVYTVYLGEEFESKLRSFTLQCIELSVVVVGLILLCLSETGVTLVGSSITGTPCPTIRASFISRLMYSWCFSLVYTGYKKTISIADAFDLPPTMQCQNIYPVFTSTWNKELKTVDTYKRVTANNFKNDSESGSSLISDEDNIQLSESSPLLSSKDVNVTKKKPSLYKVLAKVFYMYLLKSQLVGLMSDLLAFANPVLLGAVINYIENKEAYPEWQGYVMAFAFFGVNMLISILNNLRYYTAWNVGTQIKSVLTAAVYKKALSMNSDSRRQYTVGTTVNLMAVDSLRFQELCLQMFIVYTFPLQISLALYMVYTELGMAFLACLAIMALLIPISIRVTSLVRRAQNKQITIKDSRIKLMNEILNGIKVLKLSAWENSFQKKVGEVRKGELAQLRWSSILNVFSFFIWQLSPVLVTLSAFTVYVIISGESLTPAKAFVAMNTLNIIKEPMTKLPDFLSTAVQVHVSTVRLRNFLSSKDLEEPDTTVASDDYPIRIKSGTFSWDSSLPPTLRNINLKVGRGQLVAVVGAVGSGKSSLLSALLGEMERVTGRAGIQGKVAYVPQQAWIQNMSLRDNILFDQRLDGDWYKTSIKTCALGADLEQLPAGELTEIGEKGINLSGGQKQRISLARAVYHKSDVYLLDDPLSAVDTHVGKHIFNNVVGPKGVLKDKTRLLVSHGLHWLPQVDSIVVLDAGRVTETGTFDQLMDHDGPFANFIRTYLLKHQDEKIDDLEEIELREKILDKMEAITSDDDSSQRSLRKSLSVLSTELKAKNSMEKINKPSKDDKSDNKKGGKEDGQLIKEEHQEKGKVRLGVFIAILQAFGYLPALVIPICLAVFIGFNVGSGFWLSTWTDDPYLNNVNNTGTDKYSNDTYYYLGIYALFSILQICGSLSYVLVLMINFIKAVGRIHTQMLTAILRQSMAFFDTTPMGRILNRFSSDQEQLDYQIPRMFRLALNQGSVVLSIIIVISYSAPIFLALVVPLLFIYYLAQKFTIPSSRQCRRLDSVTRSPIFSHFAESLSGASSIRAYRQTERFAQDSQHLVDINNFWFYATESGRRWLRIRLEVLGNFVSLFAALYAVINNDMSPSLAGLSITYALQIRAALNMLVQTLTQLEAKNVSAERILEYANLPHEPDWVVSEHRPPVDWPQHGEIVFTNYSTRYRPGLDLVLKHLTFTIKPGEKVGVVGRTGAGKSSMSMALFRVLEAASGQVEIDGLDISTIGLHDLRDRLTILPQDPVLFSSSLRYNLDPFDSHSDSEIWAALRQAHLTDFVESLPLGLEHVCEEGGQNLSVGQRQLVCLARALLRKCKVLVLDEATAAVDMETDSLLQAAIREALRNRTLITVAHRLNTIIDYDRILVLHEGRVKELDTPKNLLADKHSTFYSMAKEAGLV